MDGDDISYASMHDIKVGRFLLIDGVACKVVDIDISSPGKAWPCEDARNSNRNIRWGEENPSEAQ